MRETDFNLHWSSTHYSGGHYHIKTVSAKNWITRNASPEKSWLLFHIKEELNMTPVEMTPDDSWAVWCHDDGGGMWSYDRAVMLCPPPSVTPVASQPCDTQVAELTSAEVTSEPCDIQVTIRASAARSLIPSQNSCRRKYGIRSVECVDYIYYLFSTRQQCRVRTNCVEVAVLTQTLTLTPALHLIETFSDSSQTVWT